MNDEEYLMVNPSFYFYKLSFQLRDGQTFNFPKLKNLSFASKLVTITL